MSAHFEYKRDSRRVNYVSTGDQVLEKVCNSSSRNLAGFETEDRYIALRKQICKLVPARFTYFGTWIASAVKNDFPHKHSLDFGYTNIEELENVQRLVKTRESESETRYFDSPV